MGGVLAWVVCLREWRANVGYLVGMLARVVCQRGYGGWCASVGGVGGILKRVALVILKEIPGW